MEGNKIIFNPDNSVIRKGILYGIFKRNGNVKIHNRVYEQRIYDYMASNIAIKINTEEYAFEHQFHLPNNELNFQKILLKFQQFIKEQYSEKDRDFLERQWRLIFLAFVKPIINGGGYDFKEVQVSQEKRLDVVITYHQHRYIVELKKWYGQVYHEAGLDQLADYLNIHGVEKGYLVIFDNRKDKVFREESVEHKGKEIFGIWV
jgi:hypothetical protein